MGRLGREKKLNLSVWVKRHNERKTQEWTKPPIKRDRLN
jgi:hypothetical protein